MNNSDFTITLRVDASPKKVFDAINNVRGWWITEIEGSSEKPGDEFAVQFWDVHYSKQRLVEVVPNTKVVWLVVESQLNFLADKGEWNGTRIIFEITPKNDKTEVRFTHSGLVPAIQCYKDCSNAWTGYIKDSLFNFITSGKGEPTVIETAEKNNH